MRLVWLIIGLILAFLVQTSFFGAAHIWGVVPNVLLVALVLLVPVLAPAEVVTTAAIIGFSLDLYSGSDFGLRTAYFVMAAMALLVLRSSGVDSERSMTGMGLILAAIVVYNLAIAGALAFAGTAPTIFDVFAG